MNARNKLFCLLSTVIIITLLLTACATGLANQTNQAKPTLTSTPVPNICGEYVVTRVGEFERPYFPDNSGLKSKNIRTLTMGGNGLWIGYADVGVGFFDGRFWRFCLQTPLVNAIAIDENGHPWVGTDSTPTQNALLHFDGKSWTDMTANLPDYRVYSLTWHDSNLYVGTWEGVAEYDGMYWTVPYNTTQNLFNNHIHAVAFARNGDIWFGSIDQGITWYSLKNETFPWIPLDTPEANLGSAHHELGGMNTREIAEHPSKPEVWFVFDPGEVTMYNYEAQTWTRYAVPDGHVNDVAFDHFGRVWIATAVGVFYYENDVWKPMPYDYPALAIAFGCDGCTFGPDVLFIGTKGFGLIQANVPPQSTK